ncbi:uncharacterized protein LOC107262935 isoform X5 [Cephus cinctus]|uniref:Uncharacterized protein LOC107262935 isoform X5 n=1 Tax=Cephus cinctus TaxID=211228 RepID=A0AAJ7FCK3_CEPCN|nr:uncharacterized protein LOC107262935 isoform X5 [Cephus cinctus]
MSDRPRHGRLPIGRSQREKENEGVTKHENERQTSGIIIVSRGNVGRISNTWAYHVHRIEDRLAGNDGWFENGWNPEYSKAT